jgi:hypothetical protein
MVFGFNFHFHNFPLLLYNCSLLGLSVHFTVKVTGYLASCIVIAEVKVSRLSQSIELIRRTDGEAEDARCCLDGLMTLDIF